ncbi:MAG: AlbA family DNA-binding domain-containing protein, partial [Polyangiaceae bacterium]
MPLEERLERLKELLALNAGHFEAVRIRCGAGRNEGSWWNIHCDALALPKGVEPARRSRCEYRETLLVERWCGPDALPDFILEAATERVIIDDTVIRFGNLFEDRPLVREPLPPMLFDSPVYRLLFPFTVRAPTSNEPHIQRGTPFHPNGGLAIHEWCELDTFDYGRPYGGVVVRLPQCRARFERLWIEGDHLHMAFRGDAPTLADAMVKGKIWSAQRTVDVEVLNLSSQDSREVRLPEQPVAAELYLVDRANEILDRHVEGFGREPWRERILPDWSRIDNEIAAVRHALATGECQTAEFKDFIRPGDQKMREVPETVVAFANTVGGVLVIGVDHHGSIVGIERGLHTETRRKGEGDLEKGALGYVGQVRKAIGDVINKLPGLHVTPLEIDGHTVLAVFVEDGPEKPYAMRDSR